ncbi:hypothetical protein [Burkholderia ubonensis]|uniref:hypothetical protein n=1 Tax=Burkholderia ubonensis TaxID=101571 RepID=UPI001E3F4207|nr:hypothetical protein [Burkholderia ubonensis]
MSAVRIAVIAFVAQALLPSSSFASARPDHPATLDALTHMPIVAPAGQDISTLRAALPNPTVLRDVPQEPHLLVLDANLATTAAPDHYRRLIERSLDERGTIVMHGTREALAALKPTDVRIWPDATTIIVTSRMGIRVDAIRDDDRRDASHIARVAAAHVTHANTAEAVLSRTDADRKRSRRAAGTGDFSKTVEFAVRPTSPVETCTAFGNQLAISAFERPINRDEQRALSREVGRWCQSGTLSRHPGTFMPSPVPTWANADKAKLNLLTEWALIRSEDALNPRNSKFYFWVKTIGEGAGSGFTRAFQDMATFSNNVMYGLVDATIHTGWGRTYLRDPRSWTYPAGSEYWPKRDPDLFGCDFGDSGSICPASASVVRLFPSDIFNNQVMVANATALQFGGTVGVTGTASATPGAQVNVLLNLNRTDTTTRTATLNLTHAQTSSAKHYSRTTRWRPDVPAVWDYLASRRVTGPFGTATPTASTLNPEYDLLWQIPLQANRGKQMLFTIIYEAGWNNCVREDCAGMRQPPDPSIPAQKRGFWADSVVVDLPS